MLSSRQLQKAWGRPRCWPNNSCHRHSRGGVPQLHAAVTSHPQHPRLSKANARPIRHSRGGVPQLHGAVLRAGQDERQLGVEAHGGDVVGVAVQRLQAGRYIGGEHVGKWASHVWGVWHGKQPAWARHGRRPPWKHSAEAARAWRCRDLAAIRITCRVHVNHIASRSQANRITQRFRSQASKSAPGCRPWSGSPTP